MSATIVIPGTTVGKLTDGGAGVGTIIVDDRIVATRLGQVGKDDLGAFVVEAARPPAAVPALDDIVLCRVQRINARLANVDIVSIGERALPYDFSGVIRKENVRATEIDKLEMHECFRPGDLVRAKVVSLGDARSYFLSTDGMEFGVVYATSDDGTELVPLSWDQMQCPVTGQIEKRKVANVQSLKAAESCT